MNLLFSSKRILRPSCRLFGSYVDGIPLQKDLPKTIDFRSDTVTQPNAALRKQMVDAPTGDDVFYDDPTINRLQDEMAKLFGKEAAILVPSGTMGNLMAMMLNCNRKGDAAIIGDMSHINNWERGNMAAAGSVFPITLQNQADGTIDLKEVEYFTRNHTPDPHLAINTLFCLETSHNECNGRVLRMDYIKQAKKVAKKYKMKMHLDGARSFNAAVFLGISPAEMCKDFDTVNVCLSKGLGAPLGSVLIGNAKDIKHCLIIRKLLGGNLRQAGIIC